MVASLEYKCSTGKGFLELDSYLEYRAKCWPLVSGQTLRRRDGGDVAVPLGFARPWWKVRLHGSAPLGSTKHAGVNAACRWGAGRFVVSRVSQESVPQQCPTRVSQRESVPREYLDTLTSADVPLHLHTSAHLYCACTSTVHCHSCASALSFSLSTHLFSWYF